MKFYQTNFVFCLLYERNPFITPPPKVNKNLNFYFEKLTEI